MQLSPHVVAHHEFLLLILTGAAKLVVQCHVVLFENAIDEPRVATRQVRGRHRVQVIRRTGTTPEGTGSRRRVLESAAEPGFARR